MRRFLVSIGVVLAAWLMIAARARSGAGAENLGHQARHARSRRCRSTSSLTRPAEPTAARRRGCWQSFAEFAQCAVERTTGLHEVWFRYDDEMEYIARARRSDIMIRQYQANSIAGQPIITSLLIDDAGLVQGYRIVNDPRVESRHAARRFRPRRYVQGHCRAWPRLHQSAARRRRTADRGLVPKEVCEKSADGRANENRSPPLLQARPIRRRSQRQSPDRKPVREFRAD